MPSRAFWELVDRLQIADEDALALIGHAGTIGKSGKRPRFRLSTRQTHIASYMAEIEAALRAVGEQPDWLRRRNRTEPFGGRTPISWMLAQEGEGPAGVLQFLNRVLLRKSLR